MEKRRLIPENFEVGKESSWFSAFIRARSQADQGWQRSQTKAHRQNFANRMCTTGNTSGVGGVA